MSESTIVNGQSPDIPQWAKDAAEELDQWLFNSPRGVVANPSDVTDGAARIVAKHAPDCSRLEALMPLFQEARDALCAINTRAAKLYSVRLDLADRMDAVGVPEQWVARKAARAAIAEVDQVKK